MAKSMLIANESGSTGERLLHLLIAGFTISQHSEIQRSPVMRRRVARVQLDGAAKRGSGAVEVQLVDEADAPQGGVCLREAIVVVERAERSVSGAAAGASTGAASASGTARSAGQLDLAGWEAMMTAASSATIASPGAARRIRTRVGIESSLSQTSCLMTSEP